MDDLVEMDDYLPINCEFHDRLEAAATIGEPCEIEFTSPDGAHQSVNTVIEDVFAKNGEEFVQLANGNQIRLDRLLSINGHRLPKRN